MANVIELVTRVVGASQAQGDLRTLVTRLNDLGRAANTAAPGLGAFASRLGSLATLASRFGPLAVAVAGTGGLVAFLKASETAAREAERAQRSLAASLAGVGVSFGLVRKDLDRTIQRLERLTGVADDELTQALSRMVQVTGDVQGSLAALSTAVDLSAARQMDLRAAAELVSRAMIGETGQLRRMGLGLREGATASEALAAIQRQVAGQGAAQLEAVKRLANAWDDFKVRVGTGIKPLFDGIRLAIATVIETLNDASDAMARFHRWWTSLLGLGAGPGALTDTEARMRGQMQMIRAQAQADAARAPVPVPVEDAVAIARLERARAGRISALQAEALGLGRVEDATRQLAEAEADLQALLEARLTPVDPRVQEAIDRVNALRIAVAQLTAEEERAFAMTATETRVREQNTRVLETAGLVTKRAVDRMVDAFLTLDDVIVSTWQGLESGAAQAFAEVLVEGRKFSDAMRALFRQLAADLVATFVRMGLQAAFAGAFAKAGGAAGAAGAQGAAAGLGGAGALAGFGLALSFAVQGASTGRFTPGRGLAALQTGGLSEAARGLDQQFFGGRLFGGAGGRAEKRRGGQVGELEALLGSIGADPALIAQFEATRGRIGTGGTFFQLRDLIGTARAAGLRGESATAALAFQADFGASQAAAQAQAGRVRGGVAGLAPEATTASAILAAGAETTLREWAKVEAFFTRLTETLDRLGQTITQGIGAGLGSAAQRFLETGGGLLAGLRQGVREAIETAIVEAVVQGTIVQGALGGLLTRLRDALALGTEDPAAIVRLIGAALPGLATTLTATLRPLRAALGGAFPGTGLGPLGVTPVPAFQAGGLVTTPTLAMLGEGGPEAVIPMGRGGIALVIDRLEIPVRVSDREIGRAAYRGLVVEARLAGHAGR